MKELKNIPAYFLIALLVITLIFGYLIFKPFFAVFAMAAIFSLLFYPVYKWLRDKIKLKGNETIAALLTVTIFVLLILVPLTNFVALLVKESIDTFPVLEEQIVEGQVSATFQGALLAIEELQIRYLPFIEQSFDFKNILLDLGGNLTSLILKNANLLLAGTTNFVISVFFMLITMYYLLKDGKKLYERTMYLTPLSNKYDKKLFQKFKEVSKTTIWGSLITAIVQGTLGAVAFMIVGFPAFFLGVATAIASLIPIIGTAIVWVPVMIVLAVMGKWGLAIFMLLWGVLIISLSDNIIRTKIIQSKSNIHPLLIFFSIFGGLQLWGFLGFIFGPLVLAIILTVLHIYELEYSDVLEK